MKDQAVHITTSRTKGFSRKTVFIMAPSRCRFGASLYCSLQKPKQAMSTMPARPPRMNTTRYRVWGGSVSSSQATSMPKARLHPAISISR